MLLRNSWSAWTRSLTNAQLAKLLDEANEVRSDRGDAPDMLRRLDVLHAEISHRERMGTWMEADWMEEA